MGTWQPSPTPTPVPSLRRGLRQAVSDIGLPDFCRVLSGALKDVKPVSCPPQVQSEDETHLWVGKCSLPGPQDRAYPSIRREQYSGAASFLTCFSEI